MDGGRHWNSLPIGNPFISESGDRWTGWTYQSNLPKSGIEKAMAALLPTNDALEKQVSEFAATLFPGVYVLPMLCGCIQRLWQDDNGTKQ